jgi:hypothetical protein
VARSETICSSSSSTRGTIDTKYVFANLFSQLKLASGTESGLAILLGLALVFGGSRLWRARGASQRLVPWCWVLCLPLLYAVRGIEVTPQHLVLIAPVFAWLAWRAADSWWMGEGEGKTRVRAMSGAGLVVAAFVLGQNLLVYAHEVVPALRAQTANMTASLIPWGRWFGQHTEPSALIATPEVGAIGYYSRRRVLDLHGVVTPSMIRELQRESSAEVIASFGFAAVARPDYLVDRATAPYSLLERSRFAFALVPLGHGPLDAAGRVGNQVYSFYRVNWAAFDSLRGSRARREPTFTH